MLKHKGKKLYKSKACGNLARRTRKDGICPKAKGPDPVYACQPLCLACLTFSRDKVPAEKGSHVCLAGSALPWWCPVSISEAMVQPHLVLRHRKKQKIQGWGALACRRCESLLFCHRGSVTQTLTDHHQLLLSNCGDLVGHFVLHTPRS